MHTSNKGGRFENEDGGGQNDRLEDVKREEGMLSEGWVMTCVGASDWTELTAGYITKQGNTVPMAT